VRVATANGRVFLDAASGEPMDPVAREAYLAALDDGWADADRLYREGRRARLLLDAAREAIAEQLGARADETVFTASGTAAVHIAVAGIAAGRLRVGRRIVASAVEHSSVLHAAEHAAALNEGSVSLVPVSKAGIVDLGAFEHELTAGQVALACLQAANHEVGTAQPVGEAWRLCAEAGVPLLVDAAAALGHTPVPQTWSAVCGSARKWGGPGGVGVLAVRKGTRFAPTGPEDEREGGRVPGPVNVPAALAAAAALRARVAELEVVAARHRELTVLIRDRVPRLVPDVEVVGDPDARLPHIVTFSCLYASGEALLTELDRAGFSVSSGSSCTASTLTPSHVLEAMGVLSHGNIRVSLPWRATADDVDRFLAALPGVVASVRAQAPALGDQTPAVGDQTSAISDTAPPLDDTPVPAASAAPPFEASDAAPANPADGPAVVIDSLGRPCPIPVIELARRITQAPVGGVVRVLADDPAARLDIPAWCEMRGHTYLGAGAEGASFDVRREH
jgi:cysteine desulfurase